jgi:hypothetical protein
MIAGALVQIASLVIALSGGGRCGKEPPLARWVAVT